ncbi:MAG: amidohydrolase family protein [Steroidobacteraceae bacterium]|jgi:cytosine/adenosine deaminase-related metal-dependent hydrolase|nr:amidohydrolase family protein [Steroidobacteraceae bacterium]
MTMSISRRNFIAAGTGATLIGAAAIGAPADAKAPVDPPRGTRVLMRGARVLTQDPAIGDFPVGDVLIEGERIAAVGASLEAGEGTTVVDARGMIVIPGFVDTHRHLWQGVLRHALPDGTLEQYFQRIIGEVRPRLEPEDVYIGNLLSALGALHAGVTTVLDWSHAGNSPAHSDAALEGLRESGIRAIYAFGTGHRGPAHAWPKDLLRLRREQIPADDGLVTLALAAGLDPADWALAREAAVPITSHVNGTGTLLPLAEHMGPDNTYIHCCRLTPEEWRLIADTGGGVSIAGPVEMQMGHGVPPFQAALDHRVPLGLGNDVETSVSGEFFGQMRMALALQRMLLHERARRGERDLPPLMTVREVLSIATLGGARVNHLAGRTGSLTPGKQADLVVLDPGTINVLPLNDPRGAVVQSMDTANVRHVFVAGRARKWNGRLVKVDEARLRRLAESSRDRLLAAREAGTPAT